MSTIDEVLVALRRLIRATDLHSRHLNKTVGLTAPQLLLLQTVCRHGEIAIGDIARSMSLSQATVTTIVDRLEARALLQRQRSAEDKRKVYVSLSSAGQQVLNDAPAALHTQLIEKFQYLEKWEQSMILASLQRLAGLMDAEWIDASPLLDIGELDRGVGGPLERVESRAVKSKKPGRGARNTAQTGTHHP